MNTLRRSAIVLLLACFDLGIVHANSAADSQPALPRTSQTSDSAQTQKQSQQSDPLAQAAKRAKEQKKQEPKAEKIWDNDNIPTTPGDISVVGESGTLKEAAAAPAANKTETPAASDQGTPDANAKSSGSQVSEKTGSDEERKAELTKQLEQAKEKLESVSTDLDILTRKYALDQQTYYSKPDYSSDTEGAVALKVEESQIATKKQEVADAQKHVDDITAKLKELEDESKPKD